MEVKTNYTYSLEDSFKRIDDMLATTGDFEETDDIKKRANLTYDNGYYVDCYALFVDIRESSSLPKYIKNECWQNSIEATYLKLLQLCKVKRIARR